MFHGIEKAVLNHFGGLSDDVASIEVDTLVTDLRRDNPKWTRGQVIEVLKGLGDLRLGIFKTGRRGRKSRFEAPRALKDVAREMVANASPDSGGSEDEATRNATPGPTINRLTHRYMLRPDYPVSLDLPADLTSGEAQRLGDFLKTLPFENG